MRDYLESLELLKDYDVEYFAPGHGNFMDNPEKLSIQLQDIDLQEKLRS